jgi:formimidoylglutamate deiminase
MQIFYAKRAYIEQCWQENVQISVDEQGIISAIKSDISEKNVPWINGPLIPGMPNLHSHAFQRAMAGLTEFAHAEQQDSFWSWRDKMYGMVDRLSPEHIRSITQYLYIEMLKAGYTSVAEFHYIHHDEQGKPYADIAEMAKQISAAADTCGIGLTITPALYSWSNFNDQPATHGQRRFINTTEQYLTLQQATAHAVSAKSHQYTGICFHSLRAVNSQQINEVLTAIPTDRPIHIHISEQQKEVNDCLQWRGLRPVEYLYQHHTVDERWCLVHATHLTENEIQLIAQSKAVVGICTTTEANLGDGFFPLPEYLKLQGRFGIGSDSHVSVNVPEEIRWLEYEHRLKTQQRNCLLNGRSGSSGKMLYQNALIGGAQALGQPVGAIAVGKRADWLVLDAKNPFVATADSSAIFDRWLFGNTQQLITDVAVGGKWVIQNGHHAAEDSTNESFIRTLHALMPISQCLTDRH